MIRQAIAAQLIFVPFPDGLDEEKFGDYDENFGTGGGYVLLETGVVVQQNEEAFYQKLVENASDYFDQD